MAQVIDHLQSLRVYVDSLSTDDGVEAGVQEFLQAFADAYDAAEPLDRAELTWASDDDDSDDAPPPAPLPSKRVNQLWGLVERGAVVDMLLDGVLPDATSARAYLATASGRRVTVAGVRRDEVERSAGMIDYAGTARPLDTDSDSGLDCRYNPFIMTAGDIVRVFAPDPDVFPVDQYPAVIEEWGDVVMPWTGCPTSEPCPRRNTPAGDVVFDAEPVGGDGGVGAVPGSGAPVSESTSGSDSESSANLGVTVLVGAVALLVLAAAAAAVL